MKKSELKYIIEEEIQSFLREANEKEETILAFLKTPEGKKYTELVKAIDKAEQEYSASNYSNNDLFKKLQNANRNEIAYRKKYIVKNSEFIKKGVIWSQVIDKIDELSKLRKI